MAKIAFEEKQNIEYKESWRDEYLKGFVVSPTHRAAEFISVWMTTMRW